MALRQLSDNERQRLEKLTQLSINTTLVQPTAIGLRKSILDATRPIRNFLKEKDVHDYVLQGLGRKQHGVVYPALLVQDDNLIKSQASLYRPKSKKGDPRVWFTKLPQFASPDDMLAITHHDGSLILFNLTRSDIGRLLTTSPQAVLSAMVADLSRSATSISEELLGKLRAIAARGLLKTVMDVRADTAIGRTIEDSLGIAMNAKKTPDYKGIELKSFKKGARENRKNLFAKVANWEISKFKSSREILENFGYFREDVHKLYCTLSTKTVNSQGLYLRVDDAAGVLNEHSNRQEIGAFAKWYLADLRQELATKHAETFWISAFRHDVNGVDHYEMIEALHTRSPILSQFDVLIEQGFITLDHLIKRKPPKKGVKEKGPLFKINSKGIGLLFPPSLKHKIAP